MRRVPTVPLGDARVAQQLRTLQRQRGRASKQRRPHTVGRCRFRGRPLMLRWCRRIIAPIRQSSTHAGTDRIHGALGFRYSEQHIALLGDRHLGKKDTRSALQGQCWETADHRRMLERIESIERRLEQDRPHFVIHERLRTNEHANDRRSLGGRSTSERLERMESLAEHAFGCQALQYCSKYPQRDLGHHERKRGEGAGSLVAHHDTG